MRAHETDIARRAMYQVGDLICVGEGLCSAWGSRHAVNIVPAASPVKAFPNIKSGRPHGRVVRSEPLDYGFAPPEGEGEPPAAGAFCDLLFAVLIDDAMSVRS